MRGRIASTFVALALALVASLPAAALAHGGGEKSGVEALARQPSRTLAQQAISELKIRGDTDDAAMRLDAALESEDKSGVDVKLLEEATETLDAGNPEGAIPLLDEALSRPLGSGKGKVLHEAGREFRPGTGTQEIVAIVTGAALALVGALALAGRTRRPRSAA